MLLGQLILTPRRITVRITGSPPPEPPDRTSEQAALLLQMYNQDDISTHRAQLTVFLKVEVFGGPSCKGFGGVGAMGIACRIIELSPMSYVSNHFVMLPSQCLLVGKPLSRCRAFVVLLSHCLLAKPFLVHLPRSLPGPSASCLRSPCSVAKPFFLEPNPCLVAKPLFPAAESLVDVLLLLSPSPSCRALLTLLLAKCCLLSPCSVAKPSSCRQVLVVLLPQDENNIEVGKLFESQSPREQQQHTACLLPWSKGSLRAWKEVFLWRERALA